MDINDSLKLERLKILAERQKYFTDLSKDTFTYFTKIFVSLSAGTIAFFSFKEKLKLDPEAFADLITGIAVLVSIIGGLSILQILFCLKRWYGYRGQENKITPDCPPAEGWAWLFEGFYILAIIVSIIFIWYGETHLANALNNDIKQEQNYKIEKDQTSY